MKYYIDTEFLEGRQREKFPINLFRKETPNTIDLISIGIVAEDGREYYEISKDFNLKEAWNRYQLEYRLVDCGMDKRNVEVYWVRENILRPIYNDLHNKEWNHYQKAKRLGIYIKIPEHKFTFRNLRRLINKYGKTNKQIKYEILQFTLDPSNEFYNWHLGTSDEYFEVISNDEQIKPEFYAYYADYDWVAFCWLFGKMIELPKSFPMYCRDLKQMLDEEEHLVPGYALNLKSHPEYPKQENQHDALSDAKWNKKLHEFLIKISE